MFGWLTSMFRRGRARPGLQPGPGDAAAGSRVAPGEAFTPTRPSAGRRQIIGRQTELERILLALRDEKAHAVLYAERGSGKTSLSNLVIEVLRRTGVTVARYTCDAESTFDTVMRGLMRDLPRALLAASPGGNSTGSAGEGCEAAFPPGPVNPRDVTTLFSRLSCPSLVCIIDEFDRIEDAGTRTRLADTIKQVSDRDIPLSFMIVGVSENVEELIGRHPSIQRNLVPLHLPLLDDRDVAALLARGGEAIGLVFPTTLVAQIAIIARGMPYMAQLLGLRVAQRAYMRGEARVTGADFAEVVERLLADARPSVLARYASLTDGGRDAEIVTALRRIATASHDPWGRLEVAQDSTFVSVGRRRISVQSWLRLQAGDVLRRVDQLGPLLVTVNDRNLLTHILLLAAKDGTLLETYDQEAREASGGAARGVHPALPTG
jgi:hypothetical protein